MSVTANLLNGFVYAENECKGKLDLSPERYGFIPTIIYPQGKYVQVGNEHFYHYRCQGKDMVFFIV
jgi:hypothetical protein